MSEMLIRPSVLTLYSDPLDPLHHCVRIVLQEKNISMDIRYVRNADKTEDLAALNPCDDVLALLDRKLVLYDPQIIMEYIDERYPHPPLQPLDPVARAENRMLRFRILRDLYKPALRLENTDELAAAKARRTLCDNFTTISQLLMHRRYFMSNEYTLLDSCMAPLLWRLRSYDLELSPGAQKHLKRYSDELLSRAAFDGSLTEDERDLYEG